MVNKKGWLRIVEASISVLIIFSVLIVVSRTSIPQASTDLTSTITPILEEIARNVSLREQIVQLGNGSLPSLQAFVGVRIKQSTIKYAVAVCNVQEICSMPTYPTGVGNVYAGERIISSTLDTYNPEKVKIFLWRVGS